MLTSEKGKNFIKQCEGLRLSAYKALKSEVFYTIGYGHYGSDVAPNMVITKMQADELFDKDLIKFESAVNKLGIADLKQNEFNALVSFAYNCGINNLRRLVKDRNKQEIADAFLLYNKAGGQVLKALTNRRKEERKMFLYDNDELTRVAKEVIQGLWGNGRQRKDKLTKAGYDYNVVQGLVNKIMVGD